jgi:oligo-1,6-glucosidase
MTVGETAGVNIREAKKYANAEGTELNMVFQFEHVGLDFDETGKWCKKKLPLVELKENMSKWETELNEIAWNSLFFCNHDQPRIVSRLGDNSPQSAKCIATVLHMMQGTPYVYQGEELGMTNYPFRSIEDFRDLESINAYYELTQAGLRQPEELLDAIAYKSRDNARTPMQWDSSENAGFTTGTPWLPVNPNYTTINAQAQLQDPDSVFHYYRKLIALRRNSPWSDLIVYGDYQLLAPEDPNIFAYIRRFEGKTLCVVCNLTAKPAKFSVPENLLMGSSELILSNIGQNVLTDTVEMLPWQANVWVISE